MLEIESEKDYQIVFSELSKKRKSSSILKMLMNSFEKYRQKRKIGWSRPQNKYGLNVFRSYYIFPLEDVIFLEKIREFTLNFLNRNDFKQEVEFVDNLMDDPNLMGFLFYHHLVENDDVFEGVTYSLGRKSKLDKRCRDRVDLILEHPICNGLVNKESGRVRLFVDPYTKPTSKEPLVEAVLPIADHLTKDLVNIAEKYYQSYAFDEKRQWNHWTQEYIDYFGERLFYPKNSAFTENK